MEGVHGYGISEQVKTDNGVEFTNRYTSCRRVQSAPATFLVAGSLGLHQNFHSSKLARFA
jgi:hypothetical protein